MFGMTSSQKKSNRLVFFFVFVFLFFSISPVVERETQFRIHFEHNLYH